MPPLSRRSLLKLRRLSLIAALAALLAPTAALASFPGEDGVIAYSVAHTAQQGIWAVDPETGYQTQIASGPDEAPSFSPSGNKLAFQRREAGTTTIYIAQANGADATPLRKGSEPAFSPDGQQIVFVRAGGLFLSGVEARSPVEQITHHPGDRRPRWSSTGQIVFQRTQIVGGRGRRAGEAHREQELDIITPPSRRATQLLSYEAQVEMWPEWSPSGRSLSVALCLLGNFPERLPATVPAIIVHPSCLPKVWSPDGRRLVSSDEQATGEAGVLSWGEPETSCPRYIPAGTDVGYYRNDVLEPESPAEISWQPILSGTMRLATTKCQPRPEPGVHRSAVAPASAGPGARLCLRPTRRHPHRRCV
jgi:dipeptidyl aminopeptidase/acylaminoacyl peptidase